MAFSNASQLDWTPGFRVVLANPEQAYAL